MLGLLTSPVVRLFGLTVSALSIGSGSWLVSGHILDAQIGEVEQQYTELTAQKNSLEAEQKANSKSQKEHEDKLEKLEVKKNYVDLKEKFDKQRQKQVEESVKNYKQLSENLKKYLQDLHAKTLDDLRRTLVSYVNFSTDCFTHSENQAELSFDSTRDSCQEAKHLSSLLFADLDGDKLFIAVK